MKRVISALLCMVALCVLLCVSVLAETTEPQVLTFGDYEYILLSDGTAEIRKYKGEEEELIIPAELNGVKVSAIGDRAFSLCNSLVSVFIPHSITTVDVNPFMSCKNLSSIRVAPDHPALAIIDGVLFSKVDKRLVCYPITKTDRNYTIPQGIMLIGDRAFSSCENIVSVTIPNSVTAIGSNVFSSCSSLSAVSIPNSVTTIGTNPFMYCKSLSNVKVSPDNPALAVIDSVLFSKTDKRLVWYPMSKEDKEYIVPQGITIIGDFAFYSCKNVTSIFIPNSVITIGDNAFSFCESLISINLPDNITVIGDMVFHSCRRLISISIPENVTSIGFSAFYSCQGLTSLTISNNVTSIGTRAFALCNNLTLTVPRDSYAAQYCQENDLNYTYHDSLDWLNQ